MSAAADDAEAAVAAFDARFDPQDFFIEGALPHTDHGPVSVFDPLGYPTAQEVAAAG